MSYEYASRGRRITVEPSKTETGSIYISAHATDEPLSGVWVPNVCAEALASGILKAADQGGVFIPEAYENVERLGDELTCGSGPEWVGASIHANPNWLRNKAANCIAIAEYIENKKQREADAEKKLQERRDALVRKFGGGGGSYAATDFPLQQAVDAYIELEDGQAKA